MGKVAGGRAASGAAAAVALLALVALPRRCGAAWMQAEPSTGWCMAATTHHWAPTELDAVSAEWDQGFWGVRFGNASDLFECLSWCERLPGCSEVGFVPANHALKYWAFCYPSRPGCARSMLEHDQTFVEPLMQIFLRAPDLLPVPSWAPGTAGALGCAHNTTTAQPGEPAPRQSFSAAFFMRSLAFRPDSGRLRRHLRDLVLGGPAWGVRMEGSRLVFAAGGAEVAAEYTAVDDGTWHSVVAVRIGGSGVIALFVDGALAARTKGEPGELPSGNLTLCSLAHEFTGEVLLPKVYEGAVLAADAVREYHRTGGCAAAPRRTVQRHTADSLVTVPAVVLPSSLLPRQFFTFGLHFGGSCPEQFPACGRTASVWLDERNSSACGAQVQCHAALCSFGSAPSSFRAPFAAPQAVGEYTLRLTGHAFTMGDQLSAAQASSWCAKDCSFPQRRWEDVGRVTVCTAPCVPGSLLMSKTVAMQGYPHGCLCGGQLCTNGEYCYDGGCQEKSDHSCWAGPREGSAPTAGVKRSFWSMCSSKLSGENCTATFECADGWRSAARPFTVRCGAATGMKYVASAAGGCEPIPCTDGPIAPAAHADYSDCLPRSTGDRCHVRCAPDFHPVQSTGQPGGELVLFCSDIRVTGANASEVRRIFDARAVRCEPNSCSAGARMLAPTVQPTRPPTGAPSAAATWAPAPTTASPRVPPTASPSSSPPTGSPAPVRCIRVAVWTADVPETMAWRVGDGAACSGHGYRERHQQVRIQCCLTIGQHTLTCTALEGRGWQRGAAVMLELTDGRWTDFCRGAVDFVRGSTREHLFNVAASGTQAPAVPTAAPTASPSECISITGVFNEQPMRKVLTMPDGSVRMTVEWPKPLKWGLMDTKCAGAVFSSPIAFPLCCLPHGVHHLSCENQGRSSWVTVPGAGGKHSAQSPLLTRFCNGMHPNWPNAVPALGGSPLWPFPVGPVDGMQPASGADSECTYFAHSLDEWADESAWEVLWQGQPSWCRSRPQRVKDAGSVVWYVCCLPPGRHEVRCKDSWGDGWTGAPRGMLLVGGIEGIAPVVRLCDKFSNGTEMVGSFEVAAKTIAPTAAPITASPTWSPLTSRPTTSPTPAPTPVNISGAWTSTHYNINILVVWEPDGRIVVFGEPPTALPPRSGWVEPDGKITLTGHRTGPPVPPNAPLPAPETGQLIGAGSGISWANDVWTRGCFNFSGYWYDVAGGTIFRVDTLAGCQARIRVSAGTYNGEPVGILTMIPVTLARVEHGTIVGGGLGYTLSIMANGHLLKAPNMTSGASPSIMKRVYMCGDADIVVALDARWSGKFCMPGFHFAPDGGFRLEAQVSVYIYGTCAVDAAWLNGDAQTVQLTSCPAHRAQGCGQRQHCALPAHAVTGDCHDIDVHAQSGDMPNPLATTRIYFDCIKQDHNGPPVHKETSSPLSTPAPASLVLSPTAAPVVPAPTCWPGPRCVHCCEGICLRCLTMQCITPTTSPLCYACWGQLWSACLVEGHPDADCRSCWKSGWRTPAPPTVPVPPPDADRPSNGEPCVTIVLRGGRFGAEASISIDPSSQGACNITGQEHQIVSQRCCLPPSPVGTQGQHFLWCMDSFGDGWQTYGAGRTAVTIDGKEYCQGFMEGSLKEAGILLVAPDVDLQPEAYPSRMSINFGSATHIVTAEHWVLDLGMEYSRQSEQWMYGWFCGDTPHRFSHTVHDYLSRSTLDSTFIMPWDDDGCRAGTSYRESPQWKIRIPNGLYTVALTFLVQQPPAASKYWDLGCVLQPEGDNLELLSGRLKPGVTSVQTATVSVLKNLLTLADHWLLPCVPNRIEVAMVYGIGSFVGTWDEALSASYGAVLGLTVEQGAGPSLVTMSHPHFVPSPMSMRITEFVMQPADYGRDRTDWVVSVSPGGDRLTFSSGRTFLRRTPCTGGNITDALQPTGDCQATAGGAVVVGNCSAQRFQAELPQGAGTMAVRVLAPAAGPGAPVLAVSAALPREHAPAVTARLGAREDNCTAAAAAGGMQLSCTVPWPAGQARISLQAIPGPAGAGPIRVEAVSLECAAPVRLATQDSEIRNTLSPGDARSGDSRAAGPTTSPSSAPTQLPTRPPSASPRSGPPAGAPQTGAPAVAPTRTPYTTGTDADLSACISRRSGDLCVPTCPSGHQAPSPFVLSCATDGSFDSSPAGMCAVDTSCGGGPLPGSAVPHADFSGCASLRTGDTCGVLFSCPSGYTAPPGRLELHCDPLTKMFNASKAGGCARNPCGVPLRGTPRADYTFCLHNRTKDPCTPACEEGWTVNGSFELVCSAAVIGGATRYLFDASSPALGAPAGPAPAVGCVPNSCAEGPAPESLTPPLSASQFAACRAMVSGQTCNISACAPPYELSEQQLPLICSSSRTFRASAIQCVLSSKPTKCTGGPLPGTASANATYTHCNKLASGDSCLVAFACATGFTSPKGILSLECDKVNGTYNASEGGDCIPNPCLTPLQTSASADSGGAAYGDCTAKVSGQTCRPSCPPGSSPSSDIALVCSRVQFGGEPQYVFDVGDSKCVPNSCSGGVRGALPFGLAGVAEDCLAKVTGQKCGLLCERGMVSEGDGTITLVCDENGTFEPGDGCYPDIGGNTKCDGGPIPGTAAEGGDYSSCTAAYSGSVCSVQWNCPLGYAAPNKQLIMHCDLMTGMYDASPAGNCTPKQCTAPLRVPPGADYSGCTALRTGGRCTPSCPPGHRPAGSFLLTCSDIQIGGRVEYVFDVAGVGCITNVCSNGPLPATLTPFMDAGCFASCIGNQTGAQCSPSCPAGFTLQPQQLGLVCAEDGTFSAAPWTCSPPPPPPPPPQCDPSACGSNGAPLADCSCSCSGNWAGADCAQCPPPYREHLGCTAPDLPSFSVSLGAESIGSFDLQGFLADAKSGMQDVKAEPQVSFVCLLPASRAAAGVTEADRRSSNCCRQPAGAQKLCTPGGAATRRGAPLGAELVAVLDVDVVGTEGGSTGDPQVAEAVTSAVQAAAAGAGGQAVAVGACGADGVKCGGVCVDRAGHCSGHGAASALGGECLCKCDKGFAGQRCEHCATGGTLCGVSPAQIAPLAGAGELLVSGTWDAVLPSSCRCPEGGAPAAAPCGAVGCQARHSSTGMRTALWAGCAEGNSTVRCAAPLRIDPGNFQLWLVLNGRDEPLAVAADGQGALSFSSIGAAGRMEVRDPLGAGVCMSTAVLPLFSQESAATSSGGSPATAGPAPAPEAPGWWRAQVYGRDSAGADVGAYSPTTCVPYRIRTERIGGGRGPALASRTACTPAQAPPCPSGWDCGGFRVGGAELAARGITAAGEYSVAIVTHSVPPFFPDQLPCDFQLIVLAGTPVAVVLDSRTEPPGWDLLLRPLSPPAVVRVMDAYGNYLTGGERRWTQSGGQWVHRELTPADLVPLYVWFTDANSTRVVTRTPAAGLTTPISKYSAAHIAEDGRGVIAEALSGAAYGRAYALCVSLSDPLTAPAGSGTLRINLPLPRCSGAGGAAQRAVYGQASCEPCPTGLVCDGSHRTRVLPGYWRAMPWDPSPTRCPLPSTCVGSPEEAGGPAEGAPVDEAAAAPDETDTPQSELEPGLCAPGAVGVLCSQCEPGWRMVQIKGGDGECRECGDPIYPYIAAAELLAAFCLLLLLCWLNIPSVLQRTGRSGQVLKLLVEALQISRLLRHVPVVSDSMVGINLIVPLVEFKPDHALLCELPNTVTLMQEILVYGFLPFVVIPFILLAQLFIKNVRFQVQRRRSRRRRTVIRPVAAELVLDPNQQVLAACGGCSSWGCHHCDTCHHNMCLHCMPLCVAKKHPISTVPLMGDGSQLKLPRRFELALGVMIGAFLVMPTMMEKFTSRWRCVQYTEPLGEGCSPLHPELCAEESRLVADARVRCDDVVTATASASFMVGWGLVASGLLFIALRAVGSRKLNGADDDPKLRDLPLQGLHSTIAVGAMRTTYFAYRKKYWWWESYNFIFKTSIFAFFSIDLPKAFLLSMMVCAASLLAHSQARPYHDQWALLFSLVVHVMLSAAMLTAAWIMQSPAASEGQLRYSDLDDFTRSLCAVVSVSCAFVFVVLFVLLVRLIRQAWPLALQIKEKGFVEDEDSVDPEAVHTARVVARIMGSGPRVMTESAVETWRARYEGEVPSLGSEEEYQHLFTVYMGLLHQADRGPVGELCRALRTPWGRSELEWYIAVSSAHLSSTKGASLPGVSGVALLILELYTMEGADIDDKLGYDVPRWQELEDFPFSSRAREIALRAWDQRKSGAAGEKEPQPALEEILRTNGITEEDEGDVVDQVQDLMRMFEEGLLTRIEKAQAAYRKYKADVGDTRNPSAYKNICWALRTLQQAVLEGRTASLLSALTEVLKQGLLNFTMVLMHSARPVAELHGGQATLWRGLGGLPAQALRWHRLLRPGSFVAWAAPTSTSFDEGAARDFATGRAILFRLHGVTEGIPLWSLSRYPQERELLIAPFSRWEVESIEDEGPRLVVTMWWRGTLRGSLDELAAERLAAAEASLAALLRSCAAPHAAAASAAAAAACPAAQLLPAPQTLLPPPRHRGAACESPSTWSVASGVADTMGGALLSSPPDAPVPPSRVAHHQAAALAAAERSSASSDTAAAASPACLVDAGGMRLSPRAAGRPARLVLADPGEEASRLSSPAASQRGCPLDAADFGSSHLSVNPLRSPRFKRVSGASLSHVQCGGDLSASGTPLAGHSPDIG